jgi:hypothetical protein
LFELTLRKIEKLISMGWLRFIGEIIPVAADFG